MIASAPTSTARRASAAVRIPFTTTLPVKRCRIHSTSDHPGGLLKIDACVFTSVSDGASTTFATWKGMPARMKRHSHRGRTIDIGPKRLMVVRLNASGKTTLFRVSRSRLAGTFVSSVRTIAPYPAASARSTKLMAPARPPRKYNWNHFVAFDASPMCSSDLLE